MSLAGITSKCIDAAYAPGNRGLRVMVKCGNAPRALRRQLMAGEDQLRSDRKPPLLAYVSWFTRESGSRVVFSNPLRPWRRQASRTEQRLRETGK